MGKEVWQKELNIRIGGLKKGFITFRVRRKEEKLL